MFTRAERNLLEDLSQQLFDSPYHWRKIHQKHKVAESAQEVEDVAYFKLKNGQIVTADKAKMMMPLDAAVQQSSCKQKHMRYVYRDATFEELKYALESALEAKTMTAMPEAERTLFAARRFVQNELLNLPQLLVKPEDVDTIQELLPLLRTDTHREAIARWQVTELNPKSFSFSAVKFLADVIFAQEEILPDDVRELPDAVDLDSISSHVQAEVVGRIEAAQSNVQTE